MARFTSMGLVVILAISFMLMSAHLSAGQAAPAPAPDCSNELLQLLPCFDFLTNSSVGIASPDCCGGLTNVSTSSPLCLCSFISPSNANQSAQLGINDTRALQLPTICNLNASPATCAALLGPAAAPGPFALVPALSPTPIIPAPILAPTARVPAPAIIGTPSIAPASSPATSVAPGPAADCLTVTASLAPCLDFLNGKDTSPSTDCCSRLGSAAQTAPSCLCSLVSSGASSGAAGINVTRALELPGLCSLPVSLDQCPSASVVPPIASEGPGTGPSDNAGVKLAMSARPFTIIAVVVAAIVYLCNELSF